MQQKGGIEGYAWRDRGLQRRHRGIHRRHRGVHWRDQRIRGMRDTPGEHQTRQDKTRQDSTQRNAHGCTGRLEESTNAPLERSRRHTGRVEEGHTTVGCVRSQSSIVGWGSLNGSPATTQPDCFVPPRRPNSMRTCGTPRTDRTTRDAPEQPRTAEHSRPEKGGSRQPAQTVAGREPPVPIGTISPAQPPGAERKSERATTAGNRA